MVVRRTVGSSCESNLRFASPIARVACDCAPVIPSISGSMMTTWRGGAAATWALPNRLFAALSTASSKGSTGGGEAGAGTAATAGAGGAGAATAADCEAAGADAAEVALTGVGVVGGGDMPANPVQPLTNAVSTIKIAARLVSCRVEPRIDTHRLHPLMIGEILSTARVRLGKSSVPFVSNWTDAPSARSVWELVLPLNLRCSELEPWGVHSGRRRTWSDCVARADAWA